MGWFEVTSLKIKKWSKDGRHNLVFLKVFVHFSASGVFASAICRIFCMKIKIKYMFTILDNSPFWPLLWLILAHLMMTAWLILAGGLLMTGDGQRSPLEMVLVSPSSLKLVTITPPLGLPPLQLPPSWEWLLGLIGFRYTYSCDFLSSIECPPAFPGQQKTKDNRFEFLFVARPLNVTRSK